MKKIGIIAAALFLGCLLLLHPSGPFVDESPVRLEEQNREDGDAIIARAFSERANNLQVSGRGTVLKLLSDDTKGSRHQRFLLRLSSGHSLLVAHNIDLAPRIDTLRKGDVIDFYGEYEWNARGGVIHWTHHDPDGGHVDGWLEHKGRRYQ